MSLSDNFNRANENPIVNPPWVQTTGHGAVQLLTNQVRGADAADDSCYYNVDLGSDDHFCDFRYTADNLDSGPCVRNQKSVATMYTYNSIANAGLGAICKVVAGVFSVISGRDTTWPGTCRLKVSGSTLQVFKDSVQIGADLGDGSIPTGKAVGPFFSGNGAEDLDDFFADVNVAASSGGGLLMTGVG